MKSNFHIIFKTYKDKKNWKASLEKNPDSYETIRDETNIYEQKAINIDEFYDVEETEVREQVKKKRKEKRREVSERNKLLKKKKKQEQLKEKEEFYWKRLGELNKQFKADKKAKKRSKEDVSNSYKIVNKYIFFSLSVVFY